MNPVGMAEYATQRAYEQQSGSTSKYQVYVSQTLYCTQESINPFNVKVTQVSTTVSSTSTTKAKSFEHGFHMVEDFFDKYSGSEDITSVQSYKTYNYYPRVSGYVYINKPVNGIYSYVSVSLDIGGTIDLTVSVNPNTFE